MLTFRFFDADGMMTVCEKLTTGMVGKQAKLEFSAEWANRRKTAVFTSGSVTKDVLNVTDIVTIPHEVLQNPGDKLYVGIYGVSEDGTQITPTIYAQGPKIFEGADPSGDESTDATLPVWAQLESRVSYLEKNGTGGGGSSDSGQNVTLTAAQINALDGMFKVCAFNKADVSAEYAAFQTAFGLTDSGGGEEEPDTPDEPVVPEVTLTSISAVYGGGDVPVGTAVTALTGIVVTGHYSDGSSKAVTGYTMSGTISEGSNTVTVSYGGKTTTFTVVGVAESGGDEPGGDEVTIYEPEANIVVTTTLDIDNTLVNVDTGATTANSSWVASDYVAIPSGKDYLALQAENTSAIRYTLYDSEKVFIKGGVLSSVTALAIEYPANAAYIRLSNNKTNIGTVTLSAGNNMVTRWGDPGNNGLDDNGNIAATAAVYRISDGYVKIPDGAKTLFWCNKSGYSFTKTECAVYDGSYVCLGIGGGNTVPEATLGANFTVHNKIDLTALSNAMYFKAHVNDGSSAINNNPAEQYVFGYI